MKNFTLFVLLFVSSITFAQVGIGTTTPDALLDLTSNTKGVLIPRVELTSKASSDPVTNTSGGAPAHATLVFNTATTTLNDNDDVVPGFYYWDTPTLRWVYVGNDPKIVSTTWNLLGNTNTNPATDFIGTTDDQDVVLKRNNLRAGLLGVNNTSFGTTALESNTIGEHNTAVGAAALQSNTTGNYNTAVGTAALQSNTEGEWNTAMGEDALLFNTIGSENTAYGAYALRQNTIGTYNTATGSEALSRNTTGNENTATGGYALNQNTTGNFNTASGSEALYNNTTGNNNTATGVRSLQANTTGENNTAYGSGALFQNIEGNNNTAIGVVSLHQNTSGENNTASGFQALRSNTTGNENTANGTFALSYNQTGPENTAIGYNSGSEIQGGSPNTASTQSIYIGANTKALDNDQTNQIVIGNSAVGKGSNTVTIGNTDITDNYFNGNVRSAAFIKTGATGTNFLRADGTDAAIAAPVWGAISGTLADQLDLQNALDAKQNAIDHLEFNTTEKTIWNNGQGNIDSNTSYGANALSSNTTGNSNTAMGSGALQANTQGEWNTAIGENVMQSNTTGVENTAIGGSALKANTTGNYNTAVGVAVLRLNTEGEDNTAIGTNALFNNTTGSNNTATGSNALEDNTTGANNTATGIRALLQNTTGSNNTTAGINALNNNTTGSNNTALGDSSGNITAGSIPNTNSESSIFIGANTKALDTNQTNQIVIGNSAIGNGSNTVTIGNTDITDNYFSGNVRSEAFIKTGATGTNFLRADGTDAAIAAPVWGAISGTLANQLDLQNALNLKASLASPTFTGTPAAPTATVGTNTTQVATTAFVLANSLNIPYLEFNNTHRTVWNNGKGNIDSNTSYGDSSLRTNTTGINNTAFGLSALQSNTIGVSNTANGTNALQSNTAGDFNTATGMWTLRLNTTGSNNTANGAFALQANSTGSDNTATGTNSLLLNSTGIENTANGVFVLASNSTGSNNTATGAYALQFNSTGSENTADGQRTLVYNTTGNSNTATGSNALNLNTTGNSNTATGSNALSLNTTGNLNTAYGANALYSNQTGNENTAIGFNSGRSIVDGATPNTTSNNSVFIGAYTKALANNETNQIVIGYNVGGKGSNTVTIGNSNITNNYFNGSVNITERVIQKEYHVSSTNNGTQTIASSVISPITFGTDTSNSNFGTRTNLSRFVAPIAGTWLVSYTINWVTVNTTGAREAFIQKNGDTNDRLAANLTYGHPTYAPRMTGSFPIYFNGTTDYVEIIVWQDSGASLNVGAPSTNFLKNIVSLQYLHP